MNLLAIFAPDRQKRQIAIAKRHALSAMIEQGVASALAAEYGPDMLGYAFRERSRAIAAVGNRRLDAIRVACRAVCQSRHGMACKCKDDPAACTAERTYGMDQTAAILALEKGGFIR